jgi:8-oxo-dGTP pyrophosphatase MutT (NUDIX family)
MISMKSSTLDDITMIKLYDRIKENNNIDNNNLKNDYVKWMIDNKVYGYLKPAFANEISKYNDVFEYDNKENLISFTSDIEKLSINEKTNAVSKVTLDLKNRNIIKGWRNELLPVVSSFSEEPVLLLERAAYPLFGMKGYGVHVNGYVRNTKTRQIEALWVATRSKNKSTWPSMLDHIVAGGQPFGLSPSENVIKECGEEAGIPLEIASKASSVGAVSYLGLDETNNLKRDVLFCYDLEIPSDFIPRPVDGEVESFQLKPIDWVITKLAEGGKLGYKPNCNLVVIDFLIRHGFISPESRYYLDLIGALRSGDCT